MSEIQLSKYQQDILDFFINHPYENIVINALAGVGKTFMLKALSDHSKTNDVYLAFNSSIATEFKSKIENPKTKVYTFHGLGLAIMNANLKEKSSSRKGVGLNNIDSAKLDNYKISRINEELYDEFYGEYEGFEHKIFITSNYSLLYNLIRSTNTFIKSKKNVKKLVDDYHIFIDYSDDNFSPPSMSEIMTWVEELDDRNKQIFEETGRIDFGDMLYITHEKLKSKEWTVPYWCLFTNVMVDEGQDATRLYLSFIKYIKRPQGRYVFVADKNQAIYAWAGSNAYAYAEIKEKFQPYMEFDLPINYRCAKSHLKMVNEKFHIPIKPRPDAPEGEIIEHFDKKKIKDFISPGDFVISRKNKWLSDVTIDLIKAKIPVYIEDQEMLKEIGKVVDSCKGKGIKNLSRKVNNNIKSYYLKLEELNMYHQDKQKDEKEIDDIEDEKEEIKNNALKTQAETIIETNSKIDNLSFLNSILEMYEQDYPQGTVANFSVYLKDILSTRSKDSVRLCSVHKAKGLEAPNVFVLNEAKICFNPRNSAEQNAQEQNLSYISMTRAKEKLYLVIEENVEEKEE